MQYLLSYTLKIRGGSLHTAFAICHHEGVIEAFTPTIAARYGYDHHSRHTPAPVPTTSPEFQQLRTILIEAGRSLNLWSRLEWSAAQLDTGGVYVRATLDIHDRPLFLFTDPGWLNLHFEAPLGIYVPPPHEDAVFELFYKQSKEVIYQLDEDNTLVASTGYPLRMVHRDAPAMLSRFCNRVRWSESTARSYLDEMREPLRFTLLPEVKVLES